jgi:hypothetical protein
MLYQQASVVINSNIENVWNILKKSMTSGDNKNIFPGCYDITDISETDGKVSRKLIFTDRIEEEQVIVNFNNFRINILIQNNQNYFAEYNYILLKPSEEFLSEKNTSLIIISAWRMHPGVFAAPTIDKQKYIDEIANNIKRDCEQTDITL